MTVHDVGTDAPNGAKFDSSRQREAFCLPAGSRTSDQGWDEGVAKIASERPPGRSVLPTLPIREAGLPKSNSFPSNDR